MTTVCVLPLFFSCFQFPETYTPLWSAELCELSKLGALLKWVGVFEANAPAIRKEWFSMYGAKRDSRLHQSLFASARLAQGSGCQYANCRTCRGQASTATFVASMVVMVWEVAQLVSGIVRPKAVHASEAVAGAEIQRAHELVVARVLLASGTLVPAWSALRYRA